MKIKVFIIDGDSSARIGLKRLLMAAGFLVEAFDSTDKFFEIVEEFSSGCILLDLQTVGISGDELALELKNRKIKLPIIVVSADNKAETRLKAQKIDAIGFFSKPVDGSALLDAVYWALQLKHKNGDLDKL